MFGWFWSRSLRYALFKRSKVQGSTLGSNNTARQSRNQKDRSISRKDAKGFQHPSLRSDDTLCPLDRSETSLFSRITWRAWRLGGRMSLRNAGRHPKSHRSTLVLKPAANCLSRHTHGLRILACATIGRRSGLQSGHCVPVIVNNYLINCLFHEL
jgi:hypothetical protein